MARRVAGKSQEKSSSGKETLPRQGKPPKYGDAYAMEKGASRMTGYATGGARGAPVKGYAREYPVAPSRGRGYRPKTF